MRTAVVRVGVDPSGELTLRPVDAPAWPRCAELAADAGAELIDNDLAAMPPTRREVEMLIAGDDPRALQDKAISLCATAFGTDAGPPAC